MSNVIQFTPKSKPYVPTPEEQQDTFIDDQVEDYILKCMLSFDDADVDVLLNNDLSTTKMIAFLREVMVSTLLMFKNQPHPLQTFADEIIEFSDDEPPHEIEINVD